jgi:hypothetical protein
LMNWVEANLRYASEVNIPLQDFLLARIGNSIPITIEKFDTFEFQMEIGQSTNTGYSLNGGYGDLTPGSIQGISVAALTSFSASNQITVLLMGNGVQIPSVGAGGIDVYFEGYASNPVLFTWSVADTRYNSAIDPALDAFLIANIGNTIGVTGVALSPIPVNLPGP